MKFGLPPTLGEFKAAVSHHKGSTAPEATGLTYNMVKGWSDPVILRVHELLTHLRVRWPHPFVASVWGSLCSKPKDSSNPRPDPRPGPPPDHTGSEYDGHLTQASTILGSQKVTDTTALVASISTMAKAAFISWSSKDLQALDVPLNRAFRRLQQLPQRTPTVYSTCAQPKAA